MELNDIMTCTRLWSDLLPRTISVACVLCFRYHWLEAASYTIIHQKSNLALVLNTWTWRPPPSIARVDLVNCDVTVQHASTTAELKTTNKRRQLSWRSINQNMEIHKSNYGDPLTELWRSIKSNYWDLWLELWISIAESWRSVKHLWRSTNHSWRSMI